MDLTHLGPHLTSVLAIAIVVSLAKPFLERRVPPAHPLHDPLIRLLAVLLGIAGMTFDYLAHAGFTAPGLENAIGAGLLAGVGAILTYHVVAGSMFDAVSHS